MPSTSPEVASATALRQGDHVCWSYASDDDHALVLGEYLAWGVEANERLLYFGADGSERRALDGLRRAGHDPDALLARGQLVLGDAAEAYLPDGAFDAAAQIEGFRETARQAVADGYSGIRVAAENACVVNHPLVRDEWYDYEIRVELLIATEPIVGMCSFDRRQCSTESLALLDAVHRVRLDPDGSAPRMTFQLHGRPDGGLALSGEVDLATSGTLERLLAGAADHLEPMVLDVSGLSFIDAAGVRALTHVARQRGANSPLELQGASSFFRRIWSLVGPTADWPVVPQTRV